MSSDDAALIEMLLAHVDARPAASHTSRDIAAALGVPVQVLHDTLRSELQVTATEFVRHHRFDRVHRDLLAGEPGTLTVPAYARKWGFVHFGRFTTAYQARHGESPETTLARATTDPQ